MLERERVTRRGEEHDHVADLYSHWVAQRSQKHFQRQTEADRVRILEMLGEGAARDLLEVPVTYEIERRHNRLIVGRVDPNAG